MAQFFKYFFAALLALFVFCILVFFLFIGFVSVLTSAEEVVLEPHSVLYLDLGKEITEQSKENPLGPFSMDEDLVAPGIFDIVQMLHFAKSDDQVDGIYLKCGSNANGFGTSEEIRNALLDFKKSGKFIVAYGEVIPQRAYNVANAASKLYVHPRGGVEWKGFGMQYMFFKNALDRLEIQPQIFYAGKFKSATEPFRAEEMTPANKLQSKVLLEDLYQHFIFNAAQARKLDSSHLRALADSFAIQTADDAVKAGLVDGKRYEDEVKEELRRNSGGSDIDKIQFVSMTKYAEAVNYKGGKGSDRIAIIYAQGDIVDGSGDETQIGGDRFRKYIRKARLDAKVKAIVIRINSGGGSAMASENMWREIGLAKKDKPIIVSYGDVAASGGYYMACNADSIFALPTTITGSIGVFSIVPNMQGFFKNKLGITFDEVETSQAATSPSIAEPLSDLERRYFQAGVDSIYQVFLSRVAEGRKMQVAMVDSIGQGRVWSGKRGLELGLVDRIGGITDAMNAAAKMAKIKDYRIREYPEQVGLLERLTGSYKKTVGTSSLRAEIGEDFYGLYQDWQQLKTTIGEAQMKLPYRMVFK